jgi:glycosyltransferase involved in cell wall biosynthesis
MDRVYVLRPEAAEDIADRWPSVRPRLRAFTVPVDPTAFAGLTAVDRRAERRMLTTSMGIPSNAKLVVFAGRLEGQKQPLAIPEIAAAMADAAHRGGANGHGPGPLEVHFLVAGTGGLEAALVERARRDAPGRVHLLGALSRQRLATVMAASDALVLPSAFEGLPNVVLESLACGTPVVASSSSGRTAEVLVDGATGLVAGPAPAEMADALRRVLSWNGRVRRACRDAVATYGPASVNEPIYAELRELATAT